MTVPEFRSLLSQAQSVETARMKHRQALLYLATAVAITYSAYNHLAFTARGIENLAVSHVRAAWPVLFLFASLPLMLLSAVIAFVEEVRSARMALVGAALAWGYYLITIPALFCLISILVFVAPKAILANVIPCLLLAITMVFSSRVARVFRKTAAQGKAR